MQEPPPDDHVYLDSNVIIDYCAAMNERWEPADDLSHKSNQQRVAAARLVFYGYRGRISPGSQVPWRLVTSSKARQEISRRGVDLVTGFIPEIDLTRDAPDRATVEGAVELIMSVTGITDPDDAEHLAQASLRPWVRYVVTSDATFLRRSSGFNHPVELLSVFEAVELLQIGPGELPPMGLKDRPLPCWLVPDSTSG
jgi:hypothetical protein